jgi:coenzyme F420-reducing hydrogenase beta subunit
MQSDENGFLQPVIDYNQCIGCRKCVRSCPVINKPILDRSSEPKVYACWHKNDDVRMKSSSGGAFSALAEIVLEHKGVVFGATYDLNMHVNHISIESIHDLDRLRRSKYVQSQIGNAFQQTRKYLATNRLVLFVGTPCQIAGLYGFLGKEYDNLITVDLICGGGPSPQVFNAYIKKIESHYKIKLNDINFRDKRHGWENNTVIAMSSDKQYHLKGNNNNYYFASYILHYTLRESCYQCPFVGIPRLGDITIADFWGIKDDNQITQKEINKGISLIMVNNDYTYSHIFPVLKEKMIIYKRSFEEAKTGNSPMLNPPDKPHKRNEFFAVFNEYGYEIATKLYIKYPFEKRLIQFLKENFGIRWLTVLRKLKKGILTLRNLW